MNRPFQLIYVVFVISAMLQGKADGQEPAQINLKSDVTVSRRLVTIGDVAEISGGDSGRIGLISSLDLDVVPDTNVVSVNSNQVRLRIILEGLPGSSFELSGEQDIAVTYSPERQHRPLLRSMIANGIADQFGLPANDVRVTIKESPQIDAISRAIPAAMLQGIPLLPPSLPMGDTTILLELSDGHSVNLSQRLPVRVVVMKDVLVTRAAIPRGTVIAAEHLQTIRRPIADSSIDPVAVDSCIGRTASRDISQHEVVRTSYLAAPGQIRSRPLLSPNDYVDVVVQTGPVSVRLKNARVMSSGSPGDVIQVMNPETNKRLAAVVQDRTTVLLRN